MHDLVRNASHLRVGPAPAAVRLHKGDIMQEPVGKPSKILIVDDEQQVRELLSRWLRDEGYEVFAAGDGTEARRLLEAHNIGLATLDISMPDVSGFDLLHHVVEQHPDTAVVMLTGEGDADTAIAALTSGACGYLIKPVPREVLRFEVRRGLERRSLLIDKRNYTLRLEDRVGRQTRELRRAYEEVIYRLVSASTYRDVETGGHVKRTGLLSELLARAAGWSDSECADMRLAAPMHDVGKIGIPDAILQKPGRLTLEEFEIMKQHTVIGAEILGGSQSAVLQLARTIALCHHEKWNGKGYPAGLAGEEIPVAARIVGIVDVYDALTHGRIYRPALSEAQALSIMLEKSGSHFEPELLELFLGHLPEMREIADEHRDLPTRMNLYRKPEPEASAELEDTILVR